MLSENKPNFKKQSQNKDDHTKEESWTMEKHTSIPSKQEDSYVRDSSLGCHEDEIS